MRWLDSLRQIIAKRAGQDQSGRKPNRPALGVERLEDRKLLDVALGAGPPDVVLNGGPNRDFIAINFDVQTNQIVVLDSSREAFRFNSNAVDTITVNGMGGDDFITVAPLIRQQVTLNGGAGNDVLHANKARFDPNIDPTDAQAILNGNGGDDKLIGSPLPDILVGGAGNDYLNGKKSIDFLDAADGEVDTVVNGFNYLAGVFDLPSVDVGLDIVLNEVAPPQTITAGNVTTILQRAAAASASEDAIIAIVDRNGRILGVRVEAGVDAAITGTIESLAFAIDGAVAKARTGAFFGNNEAPLTSRTIQNISQSTKTQREIESMPTIFALGSAIPAGTGNADTINASTLYGPGFVAPVGTGGHFPPNIQFTPQVDLFDIEHTNRDTFIQPGADGLKNTDDDIAITERFNGTYNTVTAPNGGLISDQSLFPPISYGDTVLTLADQQDPTIVHSLPRGVATLPGGIPIVQNGQIVGGIGVFFPGETGFATEENSVLSATFNPALPDRSLEAEFIAFAAVGGSTAAGFPFRELGGVVLGSSFDLPFGRIDLVGITLDVFGPGGVKGPENLVAFGNTLGRGDPNSSSAAALATANAFAGTATVGDNLPVNDAGAAALDGLPVPQGFLIGPMNSITPGGPTANDVARIVLQAIGKADETRAAIRLPNSTRAKFVFAVADLDGNLLGLFRQPDSTVFSIDVAVAKARNVAYYANPVALEPIDQLDGIPAGVAFQNRTFRYLAEPRFPEGIDGAAPGPFSTLNDGGANLFTALQEGPRLTTAAFTSVAGFDAFHPSTNFRDFINEPPGTDRENQNGIVFFPGATPLYRGNTLIGGFGVSGDGVDEDDSVTFGGASGFAPPTSVLRADQVFFRDIRLPFFKFKRNTDG